MNKQTLPAPYQSQVAALLRKTPATGLQQDQTRFTGQKVLGLTTEATLKQSLLSSNESYMRQPRMSRNVYGVRSQTTSRTFL